MFPNPYTLPNIFNQGTYRSIVDLQNEYSIVNKLNSKDVLANYSIELENKLPRINKRLKIISEKQNELIQRQSKIAGEKQFINFLQKDLDDMKKIILTNQSHCCCRFNGMPMMPFPQYQMPFHEYQNENQMQRNPMHNQEPRKSNQSSSQNLGKNKGKSGKKKGRNFRKYVYAVYFCIFLKYYSAKFTKNRYQFFKQRYLSNNGQKVKEDSYKITKTLEQIDLINIAAQAEDSISDKVSSLSLANTTKINLKQIDQLIPSKKFLQFEKALNFINLYIKEVEEIVLSQKFLDLYAEIIGIGTINQSFYMDDLMIPQEIQFITFSEKKGFAKISSETQKILIMTYIFIKHIMFKILLKLKDRKYLESKLKGTYAKFQDEQENIYEFLELVSAIFYSLVDIIFLEYLQNAPETNYKKLKKRFKISPAKVLTAPNCPKNLKENINYEELIAGVPKIKQITAFLKDQKYDDYLGYLVEQIQNFSKKLLDSVKYINKEVYDHIKPETLKQPYLIFEGMKNEKSFSQNTAKKVPFQENNSLPNPASRISNTSLGLNSKLFKKTKY